MLELQVEPLWSMLGLMTHGKTTYPQDQLRYAWKMLLKNHPHDSICGCSRDEVHRDNEQRFKRVLEVGNELLRRGMLQLTSRIARAGLGGTPYFLVVANTLPTERSETVWARVHIPDDDGIWDVCLRDDRDRAVAFDVVEDRRRNRMTVSPINLPGQIPCRELLIRFYADKVPACGYRVYTLSPRKGKLRIQSPVKQPKRTVLENEYLKISIGAAGNVNMVDKRTGVVTRDLLSLEDVADIGHSYNFIAASGDDPLDISKECPKVTLLEKTRLSQSVELAWSPKLPAEYDCRTGRRSARRLTNSIALVLTLRRGCRQLDIDATVVNQSKDHRLRLLVNSQVASDFSFAAAPFEIVKRDRRDLLAAIRDDGTQPNSGMVVTKDRERAMAVLNEGVYEYEHLLNKQGTLAFTLVRATGLVSSGGSGIPDVGESIAPEWICRENQCLRRVHLRLAIVSGVRNLAELERLRLAFSAPLQTRFDAADPHTFSGGRVCVQDSQIREIFYRDLPEADVSLPVKGSALKLKGGTVFSALKKAEKGDGFVIRSYNPSARSVRQTLQGSAVHSMPQLALDESMLGDPSAAVEVGANQIVTVGLTPA